MTAGKTTSNIGPRIRFTAHKGDLEVRIGQRGERWKETALITWVTAWLFCGVYFGVSLLLATDRNLMIFLAVSLVFWGYFFLKMGRVLLWRLDGEEIITVKKGELSLRNRYWIFGRPRIFPVQNIRKLSVIHVSETSFLSFLEQGYWMMAGERFGFSYLGRQYRFGKQLTDKEVKALFQLLDTAFRDSR